MIQTWVALGFIMGVAFSIVVLTKIYQAKNSKSPKPRFPRFFLNINILNLAEVVKKSVKDKVKGEEKGEGWYLGKNLKRAAASVASEAASTVLPPPPHSGATLTPLLDRRWLPTPHRSKRWSPKRLAPPRLKKSPYNSLKLASR